MQSSLVIHLEELFWEYHQMNLSFRPTKTYAKDIGLIIVLILLLIAYWKNNLVLILPATGILIAAMTVPMIFMPAAVIWYYFSLLLQKITNPIVLAIVFIGVITPVGLIRRCLGYDPMKKEFWKKGAGTVFVDKNHIFTASDLTTPF
jgi:hypothetical protein